MQTNMKIYVTIKPKVKSRELYERLKPYNVNVMDLGNKVYVYTQIQLSRANLEKVLAICNEYGECFIDAHMV